MQCRNQRPYGEIDRIAGTAIMSSLARLPDRAEKVPNLFVDMSESKTSEPVMKPGVA
jgi:hypothetical protein